MGTTVEEARAYLTDTTPDSVCSFCGKMMEDVERMIATNEASICDQCIREFHRSLEDSDPSKRTPNGGAS